MDDGVVADDRTGGVGDDDGIGADGLGAQAGNRVAGGVGSGDILAGEPPLVLEVGAGCGDGKCYARGRSLRGERGWLDGDGGCDVVGAEITVHEDHCAGGDVAGVARGDGDEVVAGLEINAIDIPRGGAEADAVAAAVA